MRKLPLVLVMAAVANASGEVPGFTRFYANGGDPVEGGLLLLGELGCLNCHASKAALDSRAGPVLTGVGSRLRSGYIEKVLAGTAAPGMPQFPALSADQRAAVVQLLVSSKSSPLPVTAGSAERGRTLFEHTGCAACHGTTIATARDKYLPGALAAFVRGPMATHPSGRMPRFPLEPQQAADLEAYLSKGAAAETTRPVTPPSAGRRVFASAGCGNCHRLEVQQQPITSTLSTAPVESLPLHLDRGCLDPATRSTPRFVLTTPEREALRSAIRALAKGHPISDAQSLELRLTALNCYACHTRNTKSGPEPARLDFFTVIQDTDLGDEGRLPPPLTAAGYKLTEEALRDGIEGKTRVHPQMATRMPSFGSDHANQLARLFAAVDMPDGFKSTGRIGRNAAGRELVGAKGLGCINCHNLRGRKSLGIGASDLALAPGRLRAEWFRDFLMEPSRFHPSTRMPSFWPGGAATNRKVSRGNTAAQIDSIWVYLMEVDQTRLPVGLEDKGAFELKPSDHAIVLRAFMKDAGTHAVAVGFPQQVHAVFDSNQVRWALVWRGRFVDAESVWEDRFNPPMSPLGTGVVVLPQGGAFASLVNQDAPWPAAVPGYKFRGYRLDAGGVPAFLYDYEGAHIVDRLAPSSSGGFERTVEVDAPQAMWFRAGSGKVIVQRGGWFVIDSRLRLRVGSHQAVQRLNDVIVPLPLGRHTVRLEVEW
ncbi:MAG: hypothetical protein ACKV22_24605 [Bryobacteraceae bacterium]